MDRNSQQPQQRDMVYCHQCENEWYRDEHGLTCPECQSDFTEIIEANHDPREDNMHIPADTPDHFSPPHNHSEFYAEDPDEEDIDSVGGGGWTRNGPGEPPGMHYHGTFNRTFTLGGQGQGQGQQQGQQGGGGLFGALGSLLQGAIGGQGDQQQQQQQQRPQSPAGTSRAASQPGTPRGGTSVRHVHGPGYHMTIATSSNMGGNLFPRDANAPQPLNAQPDNIQDMMAQMMMNIIGPQGMHGGMRMGGPGMMYDEPFNHGGPGQFQGGAPTPFGHIFQLLGMPGAGPQGQFGDAVFSQEALDRVITQLMEQHQTGNAPGPATEAAIKSLPTKTIDLKDLGENGKGECSICMDEVLPGATVTELPCHHWFHGDCIRAWLSEHDTCPHCRQGIMPKDNQGADANRPRQPSQAPLNDMNSPEYYARPQQQQMPGGFPAYPRQNSADGSRAHPFTVPDSPTLNRRTSGGMGGSGGANARQGSSSGTGGLYNRMRDAFGGGGNASGNSNGGNNN